MSLPVVRQELLQRKIAKDFHCAYTNCQIISARPWISRQKAGTVYAFGSNEEGQLGLPGQPVRAWLASPFLVVMFCKETLLLTPLTWLSLSNSPRPRLRWLAWMQKS